METCVGTTVEICAQDSIDTTVCHEVKKQGRNCRLDMTHMLRMKSKSVNESKLVPADRNESSGYRSTGLSISSTLVERDYGDSDNSGQLGKLCEKEP